MAKKNPNTFIKYSSIHRFSSVPTPVLYPNKLKKAGRKCIRRSNTKKAKSNMIRILYTNVNGLLSKKSSLLQLIEKNCINIVAITELKYQDQVSSKHQIFVIKVTNLLGKKKMEVDFIYLLSAY